MTKPSPSQARRLSEPTGPLRHPGAGLPGRNVKPYGRWHWLFSGIRPVLLAALLVESHALADPGATTASLGVGLQAGSQTADWSAGGVTHLEGAYGLSDELAVHGRAVLGRSFFAPRNQDETWLSGGLGLTWSLDVLRFVPYAQLSLIVARRGAEAELGAGSALDLGLRYWINRHWLVGGGYRASVLPGFASRGNDTLWRHAAFVTVTRQWD